MGFRDEEDSDWLWESKCYDAPAVVYNHEQNSLFNAKVTCVQDTCRINCMLHMALQDTRDIAIENGSGI